MREEKQLLLDEIKEKIETSKGFIVAQYQNLTAPRARELRHLLADAEAEFEVVRKRVFSKAVEAAGIRLIDVDLQGHIGIVFAHGDTTAAVKKVVQYGDENEKAVAVLGGIIDGTACSAEEVEAIAKLPSLNVLRAQLLGLFEAPMSQTVGALQAVMTSILYAMEEKSKKEKV